MKARTKKITSVSKPAVKEGSLCARCGRRPSHPHYGGGLVGGVYCNWFCARTAHLATGCGVYRLDPGRKYVEIIAPTRVHWLDDGPPSPSVLAEQARAIAQPKLELLLASGMRPHGSKPPPKTTADCVEHIFGLSDAFKAIGALPVDASPATTKFINGAHTNGAAKRP